MGLEHGQTASQRSGAFDVHGLVEALPVAALVLGLDDRLLEANGRAQALFHFGSTNGRFQDLELSRIPQLRQALELAKSGAPATLPSGTKLDAPGRFELRVSALRGREGRPAAVLLLGFDQSELEAARDQNERLRTEHAQLLEAHATSHEELLALTEELKTANDDLRRQVRQLAAAEEADARKNQFLAMLAHELRNPLAAAVNALHLIQRGARANRQISHAARIADRQLRHEARLLDGLLDVSRIVLGKITVEARPIDLRECVRAAIEGVSFAAQQRLVPITLDLPEEPLVVLGDATRLEQCVVNLLSNAMKFTPAGGSIAVSARRHGPHVRLVVRDSGVGISPEMLGHVFELFAQADTSLGRAQGGLGIGLTLVRKLVELHGGTITAASAGPGRGSEFEIRLAHQATELSGKTPEEIADPRPRRLLVVEDNRDAREMLRTVLEVQGHAVWEAGDGAGAVRLAVEHSPDVVILDLGLPDMDGFEAARRIRRRLGDSVRLVALSGYGDDEARRRGREAGFDTHLVKPVAPEDLTRVIGSL